MLNRIFKNSLTIEHIFIYVSAYILFTFIITIFLTEFSLFYFAKYVIGICTVILIAITFYLFISNKVNVNIAKKDFIAFVLVLFFCFVNSFYFHGGFAGGRDDGVYANSALYLANNNTFYIHEENVASYPGFIESPKGIITQFYLGYPSWLALFFDVFGANSIVFVNFPLLTIGLLCVYFICKTLINWKAGIITIVLISTSYPFLWFTRNTYSENLSFMLTWFGFYCLIKSFKELNKWYIILALLSINILLTVRVESIPLVVFVNLFLVFGFLRYKHKSSLITLIIIFAISIIPALYYYLALDPRYIQIFQSKLQGILGGAPNSAQTSNSTVSAVPNVGNIIEYNQPAFVFFLLQLYNLYFFILMIPLALLKSFFLENKIIKAYIMSTILLLAVNFYFLYRPSINFDQPWFLRRYMPVILPLAFICFCFMINRLNSRAKVFALSLIIVFNVIIATPIITLKQNAGVTEQIKQVNMLNENDLLLVDYNNTGRYKVAEPLFFNYNIKTVAATPSTLSDLFGKNKSKEEGLYIGQAFQIKPKLFCNSDNVYVLTTQYQPNILTDIVENRYVHKVKDFQLNYDELVKTCELFRITKKATQEHMANVNYNEAKSFCNQVPEEITYQQVKLSIYKINKSALQNTEKRLCNKI